MINDMKNVPLENWNEAYQKKLIYVDNAATSLNKPAIVNETIDEAMLMAGNPGRGSHDAAIWSSKTIYKARKVICDLLNAQDPMNIAFTLNATESLNFAINLIDDSGEIITTSMEHNSVLRPCYAHKHVKIVLADGTGHLDPASVFGAIGDNTKAVAMTHVSNVTGEIYDIAKVGAFCKEKNILFIVDGSQSCGIVPVDVESMNIDVFCFTGHKGLFGPQGTGGIYISPDLRGILRPLKKGGSGSDSASVEHPCYMPDVVEAGTMNTPGIAGLAAGVEFVMKAGIQNIRAHEESLADIFTEQLLILDGVKVYGDYTKGHVGIVAFNIRDMDSTDVCCKLNEYGICARGGLHCAPLAHQMLGTTEQGVVRVSFGWFNTVDEVFQIVDVIKILLE